MSRADLDTTMPALATSQGPAPVSSAAPRRCCLKAVGVYPIGPQVIIELSKGSAVLGAAHLISAQGIASCLLHFHGDLTLTIEPFMQLSRASRPGEV
jgi:hypothetical protein